MSRTGVALLIDDERETLAPTALRAIRLGIEILYTKWVDEARLLVDEARGRVRAVVASPALDPATVAAVRGVVRERAQDPALLAVGPQPQPGRCERLAREGFVAVLWDPYDDGDLRFLLNSCLEVPEAIAPRREPRAPTNQLCWLRLGNTRSVGVLYTLSARGAYVEMASPLPVGTALELEFELGPLEIATRARVIYRVTPEEARSVSLACGVGCVFDGLPEAQEDRIRDEVRRRAARFAVRPTDRAPRPAEDGPEPLAPSGPPA